MFRATDDTQAWFDLEGEEPSMYLSEEDYFDDLDMIGESNQSFSPLVLRTNDNKQVEKQQAANMNFDDDNFCLFPELGDMAIPLASATQYNYFNNVNGFTLFSKTKNYQEQQHANKSKYQKSPSVEENESSTKNYSLRSVTNKYVPSNRI